MDEDKFVELLWDNGQVVLHDQTGKNRRITTNFPSDISGRYVDRTNERDNKDASMSKSGRLEATDPFLNEFCLPDASYNVEPNAQNGDNDMVPWMNYPMDDSIPHEYYSEFLCDDVPEANFHSISAHVTSVPIHTNNAVGDFSKGSHSTEHGSTSKICAHGSDPLRARISHFNELPQQSQASVIPGIKSKAEDFYIGGDNDGHKGLSESFDGRKSQKQDLLTGKPLQPSTLGVMNFSHFSKPAALAMASLRNVGKLKSNENPSNPSIVTNNKNLEPAVIQCGTKDNFQCGSKRKLDPVPTKQCHETSVKTSKQMACFENSKANCHGNKNSNVTKRNSDGENKSIDHNTRWGSNFTAGLPLTRSDTKKGPEGIFATSSVCSGISAGAISNEPKHRDKRKVQEAEESSSHSDDFEDELVGQTKSATTSKGPSTKRSRAAEVHNLSERRRRDRINEKMRALQELIPNCSKVDKASMLDEAIEYLKTLQLQVQMMSMGSSLCIAPMMLPGGLQHMGMPPFPNFSQIGLGMGMGMRLGYGMGMVDMNGSPNYTLLSLPPMHRPQYHCSAPPVPAVLGMQGVPASMAPMFGIPGQGLPVSATPASTGNPASDLPPPPISSGAETNPMHALNTRPSSSYADQQEQSGKLEVIQNCGTEASKLPGCH